MSGLRQASMMCYAGSEISGQRDRRDSDRTGIVAAAARHTRHAKHIPYLFCSEVGYRADPMGQTSAPAQGRPLGSLLWRTCHRGPLRPR